MKKRLNIKTDARASGTLASTLREAGVANVSTVETQGDRLLLELCPRLHAAGGWVPCG